MSNTSPACRPDDCTLLVIDVQERLVAAIFDGEGVVRRTVQLATAARELGVHVIGTEQNPEALGPLVAPLAGLCDTTFAKSHFSAVAEEGFMRRLPGGPGTFLVAGCEAHVGVLQTTLGLLDAGHRVRWVSDAIGSRHPHDRMAAVERVRSQGAEIVTTEMAVFEWLATSQHPKFMRLSQLLR